MRIGELAARTGISTRMLRYYEEQGLITPRRRDNGYRDYDEYLVDRARKIRGLIDSGIPTRVIGSMVACLEEPQEIDVVVDPELRELLVTERDKMTAQIDILVQNRNALSRYIDAMDEAASASGTLAS